ncbi:hypothetical protein D3C73_1495890 [compost metagenome]
MESPLFHRLYGILYVTVAGHHDYLELRHLRHQRAQQVMPIHAGQRVVGEYRVGLEPLDLLQRKLRTVTHRHLEALQVQIGANVVGKDFIILDYQDAVLHVPLPLRY